MGGEERRGVERERERERERKAESLRRRSLPRVRASSDKASSMRPTDRPTVRTPERYGASRSSTIDRHARLKSRRSSRVFLFFRRTSFFVFSAKFPRFAVATSFAVRERQKMKLLVWT